MAALVRSQLNVEQGIMKEEDPHGKCPAPSTDHLQPFFFFSGCAKSQLWQGIFDLCCSMRDLWLWQSSVFWKEYFGPMFWVQSFSNCRKEII